MILPDGVKRTTGATFDADEHFIYFLAGSTDALLETQHPQVLVAVNELSTPKICDEFDRLLDSGRKVLLDSGIFNLAMNHVRAHGVSHDEALSMAPEEIDGFDQLWDQYGDIVTRYADRLWGVIELDQGGVANKPRTRARIEAEFGITPIPVYHPLLDGWDYYDQLAASYDRMCVGNLVQARPNVRIRLQWTIAERSRAYPYVWHHMLGVTPNQNLLGMPVRGSSDSSAWVANLRWPATAFHGFTMLRDVSDFPPDMWSSVGSHVGSDPKEIHAKALHMAANTAYAQHLILGSLREDTHPWL